MSKETNQLIPIDECKTVQELLGTPERWTKGWFARNYCGEKVNVNSFYACSFCLAGAIERIYQNPISRIAANTAVEKVLKEFPFKAMPYSASITAFNDTVFTNFQTIQNVIKKANI